MTSENLVPNKEQMMLHVQRLFGDCMQDGLLELSWTGPREKDRDVRSSQLFDITDLDELVEKAFSINSFSGQNVFIGAAVRKPSTTDGFRTSDADALYLPVLYADLDDPGAAESALAVCQTLKPTLIVTTGKTPHLRQQLWWKLDQPISDFTKTTSQIRAITAALGGDSSISNPSRVMRLGGSIAYPKKPGRIAELTSVEVGHDYHFAFEDFAAIFPSTIETPQTQQTKTSTLNLPDAPGVRVEDCLRDLHTESGWHQNVLRLTAHWVRIGLSDKEILLFSSALTLPHYSVNQTYRELQTMLTGARSKWAIPDPLSVVQDVPDNIPLAAHFVEELNASMIPRREWILGSMLLKHHLSILVAAPGVGKSTLCIAQAVAIVTGKEITGQKVHRRGKVWVYNNEDETDELRRRLAAALQHHGIDFSEIKGQLALNSGADRPLLVAKLMPDGSIIRTPDVEACVEHIKKNNISVFIADPFVETHELEENSNQQIKVVSQMFRNIARKADCSVLLVHHTSKPQKGSSDGYAGDMNTARGASSMIGVARIVNTFHGMSKKDAERYGVPENERHLYVRLDDAKANLSLVSPDAQWFKRVGVQIQNGEEVGTLERVILDDKLTPVQASEQHDLHHMVIAALLAQIKDPEITLNQAAIQLAWGGHSYFEKYRLNDKQGRQKAGTSLRNLIIAGCKAQIVIVNGPEACGFTIHEAVTPVMLKRFARPAAATEMASQEPEDFSGMEDENEF